MKWTPKETQFVIDHHDTMAFEVMAKKLGRPVLSVSQKARREGLLKKHRPSHMPIAPKKYTNAAVLKQKLPEWELKQFADLGSKECQFGYGLDNVLFCGKPTSKGVYCEQHYKECHQEAKAKEPTDK